MEQLQFLLNAKFVEAEWFLHAALGRGVDFLDRNLSAGGGPKGRPRLPHHQVMGSSPRCSSPAGIARIDRMREP
jgi:hypothetical protein